MSKYDAAKYKAWYDANAEKKRAYARSYYAANTEACIAASKDYRKRNPETWRKSHRKRLYGIDSATVDRMLQKQHGLCAICQKALDGKTKPSKAHIDHDHATGRVRGVLCGKC